MKSLQSLRGCLRRVYRVSGVVYEELTEFKGLSMNGLQSFGVCL